MCGNASRCIARYVHDHNLSSNNPLSLETLSGIKALSLNIKDGDIVESVTVDMGVPSMNKAEIPVDVSGENVVEMTVETPYGPVEVTAVSMGNPHGVIFVDDLASIPFDDLGPYMESHPMWPDRANIEFAQVLNDREIRMRVWERGTGETLACGTGACATAVAGVLTGRTGREVTLKLRGGDLDIKWREEDGHVLMTGPATEVFTGEYRRQS